MAGEEDPNNKKQPASSPERSRQSPDDDNPFIAFRRFADEQISSMLQSIMGLPSSATPPRSDRWAVFDEQNYRDTQRLNYNNDGKPRDDGDAPSNFENHGSSTKTNNIPPRSSRPQRSDSENPFDIDMFFNSFFDFFYPHHNSLFSHMISADSPAWPLNYLMLSPYSPLHLERQARYRSHREEGVFSSLMSSMSFSSEYDPEEPKWREAFEDLLRLENGRPMLDREPGAISKSETGKEWIQNLVKRGSLGNHWKFVSGSEMHPWSSIKLDRSNDTRNDSLPLPETEKIDLTVDETNAKQITELDLYDRFLADIDAREREFFGDFHHSPLLRLLIEDRRRGRNGILPSERDYNDDTESWLELVSGGNKHSIPVSTEAPPPPATVVETPADKPATESYVVSTQIKTDRIRLPDGSIQTKTVKSKRFADGREETNESTEIMNPRQYDQGTDQGATPDEKKNGWFWKD
ncbi:hypothetical protein BJX76DRAFT_117122 [Aspergillus varians]